MSPVGGPAAAPVLIVVEGPPGLLAAEAAQLRANGYDVREGFRAVGAIAGRTICHGAVASANDAGAAVLAALAGHGLLIGATTSRETIDRLVDDLRHIGRVDHRAEVANSPARIEIDADGRSILRLLAEGLTLREVAEQLGIPRRTADRRLAAARRALGAERTAEAIAKAGRLGWLGEP